MADITLIDDDENIVASVSLALESQGHAVKAYYDGASGLQALEKSPPDLAILDVKMPRMDGMEVLRRLRQSSDLPVIILTSKDEEIDEILGFNLGADDYMHKPFSQRLLLERVRAVLRRAQARESPVTGNQLVCGNIVIDLARRTVYVDNRPVVLSRTEWQLLQQLCANAGRVMLHEDLLTRTWGAEYRDDVQYLRVWISRLRQKLEENPAAPRFIRTVQGIGYILDAEASEEPAAVGD